ncbi:MAG: hypothetical protein ACTSRH_18280 [Promethearchaeota archaeon]
MVLIFFVDNLIYAIPKNDNMNGNIDELKVAKNFLIEVGSKGQSLIDFTRS